MTLINKSIDGFGIYQNKLVMKKPLAGKVDWNSFWKDPCVKSRETTKDTFLDNLIKLIDVFVAPNEVMSGLVLYKNDFKILDLGCGDCVFLKRLIDHGYGNSVGLDLSFSGIVNKGFKTIQGDVFSLPFRNELFNGVVLLGLVDYFEGDDISLILNEIDRIVKPPGFIFFTFANYSYVRRTIQNSLPKEEYEIFDKKEISYYYHTWIEILTLMDQWEMVCFFPTFNDNLDIIANEHTKVFLADYDNVTVIFRKK